MLSQHISCNVNACRFNDQECTCTLGGITVGNTDPSPHEKCDTECDSFEEK